MTFILEQKRKAQQELYSELSSDVSMIRACL